MEAKRKEAIYEHYSVKRTIWIAHAYPIVCFGLKTIISSIQIPCSFKEATSIDELFLKSKDTHMDDHHFYVVDCQILGDGAVLDTVRKLIALHHVTHFLFLTNDDSQQFDLLAIPQADCTFISQHDRDLKEKVKGWVLNRV